MAITAKLDNRILTKNQKFSYLNTNYTNGVTAIVLTNVVGFAANDYVLLGEFGAEATEICQVDSVTTATNTLNLKVATNSAHAESTKVTILQYNQARFYWTATTAFSAGNPITGYINIQADQLYTYGSDSVNSTGYGWGTFYNSTSLVATQNSSYIPYAGFAENSVKKIIDGFISDLNVKEAKIITADDAYRWLNDGYNFARNELNLVNKEYNAEDKYTLTSTSGLAEYSLPARISHVISVYNNSDNVSVDFIKMENVENYSYTTSNKIKYYVRGDYIGFSPTPSSAVDFIIRYVTNAATLTSYTDTINLPDNQYFILRDYMMYKACKKLRRGDSADFYKTFTDALARMKIASKRDANKDSFGIDPQANV